MPARFQEPYIECTTPETRRTGDKRRRQTTDIKTTADDDDDEGEGALQKMTRTYVDDGIVEGFDTVRTFVQAPGPAGAGIHLLKQLLSNSSSMK